jgi:hypothetical protein
MDLGDMGPGYPMLFEFMKRVGYLMFILTLTYFIPVIYMIYDIYSRTKPSSMATSGLCDDDDKVDPDAKPSIMGIIGIISTGAFVKTALKPEI